MKEYRFSRVEAARVCPAEYLLIKGALETPPMRRGRACHAAIEAYIEGCQARGTGRDEGLMEDLIAKHASLLEGEERAYATEILRGFAESQDVAVPAGFHQHAEHDLKVVLWKLRDDPIGGVAAAVVEPYESPEVVMQQAVEDGGGSFSPESVEAYFFGGRLDRLLYTDDASLAVVTDWKTNRKIQTESVLRHDAQLRAYAFLAWAHTGCQRVTCQVHYLVGRRTIEWDMETGDLEGAAEEVFAMCQAAAALDEVAPDLSSESLEAYTRPGSRCHNCGSKHLCPAIARFGRSIAGGLDGAAIPVTAYPLAKEVLAGLDELARGQADEEPIPLPDGSSLGFQTKTRRKVKEGAKRLLLKHFAPEEVLDVATLNQAGIKKLLKASNGLDRDGLLDLCTEEESYSEFGVLGADEGD